MSDRLHVITGGPGAGKTALIDALRACGVSVVAEGVRPLLRDAAAAGIDVADWRRGHGFGEAMRRYDEAAWRAAHAMPGPVFFDRGLPDIAGFYRLERLPPPPALLAAIARCRYAPVVFIAPPWPAIYATDSERVQTAAEAEASHAAMRAVYAEFGYALSELPIASVAERVRFVIDRVG